MDRLEAMLIMVAVADGGSLSQASRKLKIPLASISRKISELEAHLNVKLLIRSTRSLELTDYGRSYVGHCRRILDDIEEAERMVIGEYSAPRGLLTITAPVVFGKLHVIPIIAEFLNNFPEVNIQLLLTDSDLDLIEEKIDLAVRIGDLANSTLIASKIGEIRHITCGSSFYFNKHGKPKIPQELNLHNCINISAFGTAKNWVYYSNKGKMNIKIQPRLEVTTVEAGIEAAALGVGITRALSYQINYYLKNNKLEIILENYEPKPWPVHLVFASGRIIPNKLRSFLEFAKPKLKDHLIYIH
ncbi:LysR family transcriptional regulator [Pigmentibacter sp. JX0631]|uniref:LysR family transcriptional regulator n=1 Tax=Pigmentibacter sp. JX0631 TaxID=2976982 RepID=UPI002469002F|nr:LysR family transcriptional regulator [Pigmentibacter sp. JX0631]WGL59793.1 LysR family transcriptional regulator [Pigmentibacter sp. JX0631]